MIRIKRVYDAIEKEDGYRVLVDRLWPRGVTKQKAQLDAWEKEIAPSTQLREDFHRGMSEEEFRNDYTKELLHNDEFPIWKKQILEQEKKSNVTLITSIKLLPGNHLQILKEFLEK
ncbi:MAG: DUF488 family protein [Tissierellia bacterium]|nr:DUF488 family protein [Tissierellia bacterium]